MAFATKINTHRVQSQWAQVENAYQRRLDLVPNLVETVKFASAQQAQDGLSSALSRLTENRISVERMRFIEAAQAFNSKRDSFPTNLVANYSRARFQDKSYFKAQTEAATAPGMTF